MKTVVALALCLGLALPILGQSTSAPKSQQEREQQLRTALEQMRDAIDHYHGLFIRGKIMAKVGSQGYPSDLEDLVKTTYVHAHGQTILLLQGIPVDPMTGTTDWGLRRRSPPGFVFDVYTKSGWYSSGRHKVQRLVTASDLSLMFALIIVENRRGC